MKKTGRILSFIMAAVILFTSVNTNVYAAELGNTVSGNEIEIMEKTVLDNAVEETEESVSDSEIDETETSGTENESDKTENTVSNNENQNSNNTVSDNDIEEISISGNAFETTVSGNELTTSSSQTPPEIREYNDLLDFEVHVADFDTIAADAYVAEELIAVADNAAMMSESYGGYWDNYTSYYIYNQLSEPEQKLWRGMEILYSGYLENEIDLYEEKTEYVMVRTTEITEEDLYDLAVMFKYTHPQYYFITGGFWYSMSSTDIGIAFCVYESFQDGSYRKAETTEIKKKIDECMALVNAQTTEEEKAQVIHDWICNKVDYNHAVLTDNEITDEEEQQNFTQTAYSVFRMDKTVCAGYALSFMWLCNAADIEAFGVTSPGHAYNKVKVNDNWYNVDCTWDDRDGIGNFYYRYYLRNENSVFDDSSHAEESFWVEYLPVCNLDSGSEYSVGTLPEITETTAAPVISVNTNDTIHKVTISSATSGAKIYYTLDGKTPAESASRSNLYTGTFDINDAVTIKAVAVCDGMWDSTVTQKEIDLLEYDIHSGIYGENIQWVLDSSGCLTLTGSGEMLDMASQPSVAWYDYADEIKKIVIADTITSIGDFAFCGLSNLESFEIPENITSIGRYAFSGSALESLVIPKTVNRIESYAFSECYNLKSLVIEGNIEILDSYIFYNCGNLKDITLSDELQAIGAGMFTYCPNLKEIYLPDNLKSIGRYAFEYCYDLRDVILPDGLEVIWDYAFLECDVLEEIYIPKSVTNLGTQVFESGIKIIGHTGSMAQSYAGKYGLSFQDINKVEKLEVRFVTGIEQQVDSQYCLKKRKVKEPEELTRVGYTFGGWYTSVDLQDETTKWDFDKNRVRENTILYAKWTPNIYTLSFDLNYEGAAVIEPRDIAFDEAYGSLPEAVPPTGYLFTGWYTQAVGGERITEDMLYSIEDNSTIYAQWEAIVYIVTFDTGGGVSEITEKGVLYKLPYGELPIPKAAGKIFLGWYTDREAGQQVTAESIVDITEDLTLYAHWDLKYTTEVPKANIASGSEVMAGAYITLTTDTFQAKIYYTTDANIGSDLTPENGTLYEEPIVIPADVDEITIYAMAVCEDHKDSEVVSYSYTVTDESEYQGDIMDADWEELKAKLGIESLAEVPEGLWIAGAEAKDYTGKALTQDNIRVYYYKTLLTPNEDYRIRYSGNINAGEAKITITGKGEYSGRLVETFTIRPLDFGQAILANETVVLNYNSRVQKATNKVKYNLNGKEITLRAGRDFTYVYPGTDSNAPGYDENAFKEAGDHVVTIEGKGNYAGTKTFTQTITRKTMLKKASISRIASHEYTGTEIKPAVEVKLGGILLNPGTDYDVTYKNNVKIGTAMVTVTGKGEYAGSKTATFKITGRSLRDAVISGITNQDYCGKAVTQSGYTLTYELNDGTKEPLTEGTDYKVSYRNNEKAGTATITFTGMGHYTGTINRNYRIYAYDLTGTNIQVSTIADQTYRPAGCMPKPVVTYHSNGDIIELAEGKDYTLRYVNNREAAEQTSAKAPAVIITGKGGFAGSRTENFTIKAADLGTAVMTAKDVFYVRRANIYKTSIALYDTEGRRLTPGTDYSRNIKYTYGKDTQVTQNVNGQTITVVRSEGDIIDAKDILPAGTKVTATVTGSGKNYIGEKSVTYKVVERSSWRTEMNVNERTSVQKMVLQDKEEIKKVAEQGLLKNSFTYRVASVK